MIISLVRALGNYVQRNAHAMETLPDQVSMQIMKCDGSEHVGDKAMHLVAHSVFSF